MLNVQCWTERWTERQTLSELNVELNVERTERQNVYAKINLWIKTQGYGSTVYPTSFCKFLGGGGGAK